MLSILLAVFVVDEILKHREEKKGERTAGLLLNTLVIDLITTFGHWRLARQHRGDRDAIEATGAPQAVSDLNRLVVDLVPTLGIRDDTRQVIEHTQIITRWMSQGLSIWRRFPHSGDFEYDAGLQIIQEQAVVQAGETDFLPNRLWGPQSAGRLIGLLDLIEAAATQLEFEGQIKLAIERTLLDSLLIANRSDASNASAWLMN